MKRLYSALVLSAALCCMCLNAKADPRYERSSVKAIVSGLSDYAGLIPGDLDLSPHPARLAAPPKLSISAYVPGLGRVQVLLNKERVYKAVPTISDDRGATPDRKGVRLLQGRVTLRTSEGPAAGSIYLINGTPHLFVAFIGSTPRDGRRAYYRLDIPLSGNSARISARIQRLSNRAVIRRHCGQMLYPSLPVQSPARLASVTAQDTGGQVENANLRILQLSLDGDSAWYQIYGSNSNQTLSTFVNEAEAIYQNQLGLTYDIVRQNIFTSRSFGSSNAENKLVAYQSYTSAQSYFGGADAFHLFTGVDLDSSVIGISYVGVICNSHDNSFGLSQSTSDAFTPITFVHELGHNFGADHDTSQPPSIMYPAIMNPPAQNFSDYSKGQIGAHIAAYGNYCLGLGADPTPTPSGQPTPGGSPTSNPTNTPGGGGGSGGGPPPLAISLKLTLQANGQLAAKIALDAAKPECTVKLRGATERVVSSNMKTLVQFSPALASQTLSGVIKQKTSGAHGYVLARIDCPDGATGQTVLKEVNPTRISRARQTVNISQWLDALSKVLRKAARKL